MPPAAAPKPKPGARIFGMPAWGLALAIGGGLVVGFVFLRKPSGAGEADAGGAADESAYLTAPPSGSGASSAPAGAGGPALEDVLQGLGLSPSPYQPASYAAAAGGDVAPVYQADTMVTLPNYGPGPTAPDFFAPLANATPVQLAFAGATIGGSAGAGTGVAGATVATPNRRGSVQG